METHPLFHGAKLHRLDGPIYYIFSLLDHNHVIKLNIPLAASPTGRNELPSVWKTARRLGTLTVNRMQVQIRCSMIFGPNFLPIQCGESRGYIKLKVVLVIPFQLHHACLCSIEIMVFRNEINCRAKYTAGDNLKRFVRFFSF